jgi:hypothetical protein
VHRFNPGRLAIAATGSPDPLGPLFDRAKLSSSMVADVRAGHTYDDPVATLVQGEWRQILASIEPE